MTIHIAEVGKHLLAMGTLVPGYLLNWTKNWLKTDLKTERQEGRKEGNKEKKERNGGWMSAKACESR